MASFAKKGGIFKMSYCETFRPLNSKYPITTVTIPPDQVRRMELRTAQFIIQCGGKPLGVGFGKEEGSLAFQAIFFDDDSRKKFCDTIDAEIDSGRPFIVKEISGANGEREFEFKLNLRFMLAKFHTIMDQLQPLVYYIEHHGGWPIDSETFFGGEALDRAIAAEDISPELEKALQVFGGFMGAYFVGAAQITDPTIVHRNIAP